MSMKNMTLNNIAEACGVSVQGGSALGDAQCEAEGIVIDSRQVKAGMVFIATRGEQVDGHDFIASAVSDGAIGIVCERQPENCNIPYILVPDSFVALKQIAEYYRKQLTVKVVGITGSVGKTSTKEFVAGVLSKRYKVLKTQGNFNNEIGLPLTVLQIRKEHEIAVLEMGISDFGEMHRLAKVARPDICVLTNIGACHLENLGDKEGVLRAKSEIFDYLKEDARICINGDDAYLTTIESVEGKKPVRFGLSKKNDVYAGAVESKGLFGSTARIYMGGGFFRINIQVPGAHMVYNALAAACVGNMLGLTEEEIAEGIRDTQSVSGRSNIIAGRKNTVIDDCYNANPVSMRAAVELLVLALTRKVAILGDMFELGTNEKKEHYDVGQYVIDKKIDVLVCIGELSRNMYKGAMDKANNAQQEKASRVVTVREALGSFSKQRGGNTLENGVELQMASGKQSKECEIYHFTDKESFLQKRDKIIKDGDTILLKASHGMHFEQLSNILIK